MIQGHGPSSPEVMLIADDPHGEDHTLNYALSGHSEILLASLAKEAGMDLKSQFYRTCFIKEKVDDLYGMKDHLVKPYSDKYLPILKQEISTLKPKIIVPLGEQSFRAITGLQGIRKYRGSVLRAHYDIGKYIVIPVLGPYPYLYREYYLNFISRLDFAKIPKYLHNDVVLGEEKTNVWVAKNANSLRNYLNRSVANAEFMTVDIETFFGLITCIGISFDGVEAVSVPLLDKSIDRDQRVIMLDTMARLMKHPIPKVNQNIKYDWTMLERNGYEVNNVVGDTQLAASSLYCEFDKDLGFLTSLYTDLPYHKDEGKQTAPNAGTKDRLYLYNAKDALVTHRIYQEQKKEIEEKKVSFVYNNLVRLIPIYKDIDKRGLLVDEIQRDKLIEKYEQLFLTQLETLRSHVNITTFNPASPQQCAKLIFEHLKYKKVRGVKGTDEESLEMLKAFSEAGKGYTDIGDKILDGIINCRKIQKVLQILNLELHSDNRFRCTYNLAGTVNGRTSASKTLDQKLVVNEKGFIDATQLGHSLQTIGKHGFSIDGVTYGKDIRSMFVPTPGYEYIEIDLSQAEARVDAVLANNIDILSVFDGPVGIHRLTGSWVYDCDPSDIKKNVLVDGEDRYHLSKTVRHAGERNMKAERLVMMTQLSLKRCREILIKFHKNQPEIREVFHRDIINFVNANLHLRAPNGRLREFFGRVDTSMYNEAISYIPQAVVGDLMKFGLIEVRDKAPWAHPVVEAHDGVLSEVPLGRRDEFISIFKSSVEKPIDFRTCSLPRDYELLIPSEASVGMNWKEMKDC